MAEETERKIHSAMNKLFHSPKSNPPLSSSRKAQGQKRRYSAIESNSKGDKLEGTSHSAQPPPCRPWDRAELMRRLATFKSMSWFAKPKAVDAVNCARRGWVNVDMDIIACEGCGARLQFTTPSTWPQQQVEKAALVFSLKLDTGHKPNCPWGDNACDESLALFQSVPAPLLVDQYKERSSALLQLSALPLISGSAIESMRNPQLEYFLKQSMAVECGTGPKDSIWTDYLGTNVEAVSADSYYQAHRLLSLCGWESRLLPYMVDCGDKPEITVSNDNLTGLSVPGERNNQLCVHISGPSESTKDNENPGASSASYDPSSTVLECKLCGASVGLWAFATVPRPLELVRVVGSAEIGGGPNKATQSSSIVSNARNGKSDFSASNKVATLSMEPTLNLTIAGGPPPTKQNIRATISLPVIGRSLRARFSYLGSEARYNGEEGHVASEGLTGNLRNQEIRDPQDNVVTPNSKDDQIELASTVGDDITNGQQMQTDTTTSAKETLSIPTSEQVNNGEGGITMTASAKDFTTATIDKDLSRQSADRMMEFHPVWQHRHFCPWVASTGTTSPGWLQTLSALQKEKVFSPPNNEGSPSSPSPSLIKIDDPITSIRNLFKSPPAKRRKSAMTKNDN